MSARKIRARTTLSARPRTSGLSARAAETTLFAPTPPSAVADKTLVATHGNLVPRSGPSQLTVAEFCKRPNGQFRGLKAIDMPLPVTGGIMVNASPTQHSFRSVRRVAVAGKDPPPSRRSFHPIVLQPRANAYTCGRPAQPVAPALGHPLAAKQAADVHFAARQARHKPT